MKLYHRCWWGAGETAGGGQGLGGSVERVTRLKWVAEGGGVGVWGVALQILVVLRAHTQTHRSGIFNGCGMPYNPACCYRCPGLV